MVETIPFVWVLVLLCITAMVYGLWFAQADIRRSFYLDKKLMEREQAKPVIWLYYDHSEVNARHWLDFGARSSRALNSPFLNLCYERIAEMNKDRYRIETIEGLVGLAQLLGGWQELPSGLQNPIASVGEPEMNWIRAAVLAKKGGLWLSPSVLCMKPFGELPSDRVVFFGTDPMETYAGNQGTRVPGRHAMWVPRPDHPMMREWSQMCFDRIDEKRGGQQIRRDFHWDVVRMMDTYKALGIVMDPHAEGSRTANGKRIQLDDLLGSTVNGELPWQLSSATVYVPVPWEELSIRSNLGWFLRMSEEQILDSDLCLTWLWKKGRGNGNRRTTTTAS